MGFHSTNLKAPVPTGCLPKSVPHFSTAFGLAIANAIVKAHDGRVWVEDTPGGGATFAFEIPVRDRDVHDLPLEPVVEGDRA